MKDLKQFLADIKEKDEHTWLAEAEIDKLLAIIRVLWESNEHYATGANLIADVNSAKARDAIEQVRKVVENG